MTERRPVTTADPRPPDASPPQLNGRGSRRGAILTTTTAPAPSRKPDQPCGDCLDHSPGAERRTLAGSWRAVGSTHDTAIPASSPADRAGKVLLGADGPGGSVRLDRNGLPDGSGLADETDVIDTVDAADSANYPAARLALRDDEKQTVRA